MTPVRAEAVRTLYVQMRNSARSAMVVTAYMAGTAATTTKLHVVILWVLVQVATQFGREGLIRAWQRRQPLDAALEPWARAYVAYMAVSGSVWGSTIYLFAHPAQPISVALTMCCLYSIGAGSVPANAYNPTGLYAIVGCTFVPVVVRLVSTGEFGYTLLGLASGLYGVAMAGMCRTQARTLDDGFRIRFENTELLAALQVRTAEAEAARRQAELASLAKSQFLAAASHDLRQPLYALSLFSASLDALRLDEDGRVVVGRIQDSIGVMEQLFNGLLDLSRLDAGVVQPVLDAVSIDTMFDRLSQYFHPIAQERGLQLRFRSDGEFVTSDAALLEQALGNLVGNALRYTQRGGVLVAARRRSGKILLEVWDTGIGMAAVDLQRIFEEFVQLGNAERDRRKGLGLGLSIARRSAALIGSPVEVASQPGRGSMFRIAQPACVPVPKPDRPDGDLASVRALAACRDVKLLVVDDDRDVRAGLADLLRRWGVRFDLAADAEAAHSLVAGGAEYGLVLADYRLGPGPNGLELIASLRARYADTPPEAALVTADVDAGLISAAGALGITVLQKPLRPAQLRELLGLARMEEEKLGA